jgi:hypothetical protein
VQLGQPRPLAVWEQQLCVHKGAPELLLDALDQGADSLPAEAGHQDCVGVPVGELRFAQHQHARGVHCLDLV